MLSQTFVRNERKDATMKIGVSGASGQLGSAVLAELKARAGGHSVIGVSRTPGAVRSPAEGRHGDYDRPEMLAAAYNGLDRLLIIPSPDVRPGVGGRQLVAAIDAAVKAGVGHIVLMSSATARETAGQDMFSTYWTSEQHLMRVAPRWTTLRMNYYAESFAQVALMLLGTGVLLGLGESRVAFVSRDDVAAAAAGILVGDGHAGAIYNATGPAAVSGAERAAALSEITGKPLRFVMRDEAEFRRGLSQGGMPEMYVGAITDIEKRYVAGDFDIVSGDVERLSERGPRALRDILTAKVQ
jgi:NAD(P)H dehydrogenase (quinone)